MATARFSMKIFSFLILLMNLTFMAVNLRLGEIIKREKTHVCVGILIKKKKIRLASCNNKFQLPDIG
jgi:hypothetical protein